MQRVLPTVVASSATALGHIAVTRESVEAPTCIGRLRSDLLAGGSGDGVAKMQALSMLCIRYSRTA